MESLKRKTIQANPNTIQDAQRIGIFLIIKDLHRDIHLSAGFFHTGYFLPAQHIKVIKFSNCQASQRIPEKFEKGQHVEGYKYMYKHVSCREFWGIAI